MDIYKQMEVKDIALNFRMKRNEINLEILGHQQVKIAF